MTQKKEPLYLKCQDVMRLMDCSSTYAYGIIRKLNRELQDKGKLTKCGQVSTRYFMERYYA